jgi:uncharacterized protein (DUF305 family)
MARARVLPLAALLALAAAVVAGCGGGGETAAAPTTTAAPAAVPFDRSFIDAMVPHHEGAIEMARAAKEAGLSEPELVEVADAVLETQGAEIDRMRQWREAWFGSAEVDPAGAAALGLSESERGMQHDTSALADAADVDAAFASLMVDHHEGAVRMARLALRRAEHDELRELAREIVAAQEREIEILKPHAAGAHGGHG